MTAAASMQPDRSAWHRPAMRAVRIALALALTLALAFLAAGAAKLAGVAPLVELFERIGWGQWLRFVTAGVEIGGALLLLAPRTAWLGAGLLLATMAGATATNLALGESPAGALVLGALAALVLWIRRPGRI